MTALSQDYEKRLRLYKDKKPLFYRYGVEPEIEKIYNKRVHSKMWWTSSN